MSDPIDPLREKLASRYELIRCIGEGAHATVHLAHDLRHDRRVAIKVLRVDGQSDVGEHRFLREIRLLARLNHPNILPLYDSGFVGNLLYYAMPYVEGESLRNQLERTRQLSAGDAVAMAHDLADALAHAHSLGIVHRDVKPENILLADGRPLLADFGIAFVLDATRSDRITRTGEGRPGTPAYMSPEQLMGEGDLDARTDVYALGCVLYEMIVGAPPFAGPAGFTRRFTEEAPSPRAARREIPVALDRLVRRAIARSPDKRFATAREMSLALAAAIPATRRPAKPSPELRQTETREVTRRLPTNAIGTDATTPFIGRDAETTMLIDLLAESRLVTVLGPGGIGKTRLAHHVISQRPAHERQSILVVPLGGIASADLLWTAIANALGIAELDHGGARARVLASLRRRHVLLVLDAFEHLMQGVSTVRALLEQTLETRILVTSRVRLNLSAEAVLELDGLSVPDSAETADIDRHDAVRLFVQRARQVVPGFALDSRTAADVSEICSLVGGLPLGIELAASMLRVLDCGEIRSELARSLDVLTSTLHDVPLRHRTLRAVFDQSWSLLEEGEQNALMRLSIFAGAFSRVSAEQVGGATLAVLRALRDKSLVQHVRADRYQLHDVVRQHARERLAARGLFASVAGVHAAFFATFVETRAARLHGVEERAVIDQLVAEIDEIRAGWHHAVSTGDVSLVERYLEGLYRLYECRGWFREGAAELADAAASERADVTTARALSRYGACLLRIGDVGRSRAAHVRSLRMLRQLGVEKEMLLSLRYLAEIATVAGKYRAAERLLASAARIAAGDDRELALGDISLGHALLPQGKLDEAEQVLRRGVVRLERLGDEMAMCTALINLGCVLTDRGRLAEAEQILQRGLETARASGNQRMIGVSVLNLAHVAHLLGDNERAASLARSSLESFRAVGVEEGATVALTSLGDIEVALGRTTEALEAYREALRRATRLNAERRVMAVLVSIGELFARTSQRERAIELLRVVEGNKATEVNDLSRAASLLADLGAEPGRRGTTTTRTAITQRIVQDLLGEAPL